MTTCRRFALIAVFSLLLPVTALADTTEFRVFFDIDNTAATGCSVSGMTGVDLVLTTHVMNTETTASVTSTDLRLCAGGILGAPSILEAIGWPAGYQPASGQLTVETRAPFSVFGSGTPQNMRIGIEALRGSASHLALVRPDGSIVLFPAPARGKRRAVGTPGLGRVITVDGNDPDWNGVTPLFTGIAASGTPTLRVLSMSGFANVDDDVIYFVFQANLSTDTPFAIDDSYVRPLGEGLTVPAPGVLANDGDPNNLPLTALQVSPASLGSVTLNPDGSFTYTPDNPASSQSDTFQYKASNGSKESTPAQVTIAVDDENTPPVITSADAASVPEGETSVATVTATDAEGQTVTFSITGGADAAAFSIDSTTGALSFNVPPNFEAPADADANNVYIVQVTASDTAGGTTSQTISVTVTDVNEEPSFVSPSAFSVPENQTAIGFVAANDPEGSSITYSIGDGADMALFTINASTGALSFISGRDFEAPADAGADNVYQVQVNATDGTNIISALLSVTVTNVDEPPAITSGNAFSVPENTTAVTTVTTTDPEGNTITYSITGGADAADFTINPTTGALAFASAPNFEAPSDADANNIYDVQVNANDGTNDVAQTITVTVTDVNEAPAFTSGNAFSVPENTTAVATVAASDPEGTALTYSITGGADAGDFSINATTGALTFTAAPNFEAPADADVNNIYDVQVTATDGVNPVAQSITVTVTNVNEAPTITSGNAFSVPENTTAIVTVTTTDPEGNTITYSITGGADAGDFTINAASGALSFSAAPDFEAPADSDANNIYVVQVTANDGTNPTNQTITVTVTNVNEAPVFSSGNAPSVPENTTAVTTVVANDPEGAAIAYSISGGADAAGFSINPVTGALTFNAAPNFEAPGDADANNVYLVDVMATDGTNPVIQSLAVTVTDVNEAPVITSSATPSVPENTIAATTVTATDQEGAALTFSISGGADAADFSINATTGALTFNAAPDFEAPADADANNLYLVDVTVTDGVNPVVQSLTVTITNVDEAPAFTSGASPSVPENTTAVTTVAATDPEGVAVTYSITGGADQALFSINGATGALTFLAAPDFDAPGDADANNIYVVQVTATDGTNPVPQTLNVTVTDVNEAPVFTSGASPSVPENTTAVTTVTTTDPEGNAITYSITGGADAALFSINPATGVLTFNAAPNFEAPADAGANNVYDIVVTASDGTNAPTQNIAITVTDVNEPPLITSANTASVPENTTAVTTVTTTDPEGNTVTYSITGGADAALFSIVGATGVLTFNAAPDFEAPADADANNQYLVQVTANDGTNNTVQTITVTVTDVNETPVFTSSGTPSVPENTTAVTTVATTDPEGNTITYSITGGADMALFSINASSGALTFNSAPNFEAPADAGANNVYDIVVTASDGTNSPTQNIAITVTDVNEPPTITSSNTASVAENTTAVTTVTTTDPEGNTVTYSITGGADAALFSIVGATGVLTFNAPPDFEAPADADTNNQYLVEVTANDGTNNTPQTITVTVTDVNETPVFTSSATPSVPENQTAVMTVTTSDPEGNTITYSITGGADMALFSINSGTGALTFNAAPNFEAPADAGANNVYDIVVTASDGTNNPTQNISVTVTDANEAPVFTSGATPSVPENTTAVTTVTTTDAEGNTITYSITGGADMALFSINSSTGALTFNAAPNFEAPADAGANNVYDIVVTASDGTNAPTQNISVTVTDVNEAPTFTSSATPTVLENTTAVVTVTTTDPEGNTITYSITGGADMALFSINASTGALTFNAAPDFDAPADAGANNVYDIVVTASDGTNNPTQNISVTVTNVNEPPVITSSNTASVSENTTAVTTVTTTDPDGNSITYSITGGADAAGFSINATSGALTFSSAPDFENPTDADTNNQYIVEVTATDGANPVAQTITVTVTDVNEAPFYTSGATPSVPENMTAVVDVDATDPESAAVTYSITGGADAALFSIVAGTGVLTFNAAPNFEAPADADTNNLYLVEVTATDGTNPVMQALTVTVTDVNEGPSITSGNTASVPENTTAVTTVTTTDPESDTITYSITGGADSGDFSINSSTGVLTFSVAPNFENPADADTNNQYIVQVTATDGTTPVNQTITVTVTNVDEQPVFTSSATPSVPENTTAVVDVDATDPEAVAVTYSITGGADQALFTIVGATGVLSFLSAPDFEAPADADTNNVYLVEVTATDGTMPAVQSLSVTVTDANDPPFFTSSATPSAAENQNIAVDVNATDPEAQTLTYSITGGADAADFSINASSGLLTFNVTPNFEAPHDADTNNVYLVEVTVTEGVNPVMQAITVTVTNVNEAPTITSGNAFSVPENTVAVTTVTTTDPEGNTVTYTITGGADAADFAVDLNTGALTFAVPPNFESPADSDVNNIYIVEVTANDGTNNVPQTITVTVTAVDEAPAFTSGATPSVPENTTAVVDVDATDPEGAGVTYSITGGADAADFSINNGTGVLTFNVSPNFEAPHDADTNNIYFVEVTATDGTNPQMQALTVTVTNVNEAPSFTSGNTPSVPENTTAVVDVDATDPDGTSPTYSITGGADAADFSIVPATGVLTFVVSPNFEAPHDADTNNIYLVEVTATDGTNPVMQAITVTVTDVNEAPVITSSNAASVAENQTSAIDVDATDPEGVSPTYSITGGADAADFTIVPATGVLTFAATPNFEAPADADTNNTYIVQVTATDGTNPVNQTITITVTNVNEAPVNTLQDNTVSTNEDINLIFSAGNANQITIADPDGDVNVQVTLTATNGTLSTNGVAGLTFTPPGAGNDGVDDTTMVFTGTISVINARLNGMTYKPNLNYYGAAAVTILTNDQGNTGSGGALSSNGGVADSIAVTINPVNDPPTATVKTHTTHSGIGFTISAATHTGELKEGAADVDDHDPFSELTVQIVGGSISPANATLTLIDANDGSFYFEPPGGIGADDTAPTFQFQVCDNGDVGLGLAATCSTATTVTINLTGADTWFVDDTDAAGCGVNCNGARTKPLVGLNNAALVGRGTGDKVFAFSGTYNHGFTMAASESLIGQASSGSFDTVLGVSVPGNGTLDTRPTLSGAAVTLQNTVTAANSTLVRGLTLATGANKGYVAAAATTLTVLESSVNSTGNMAIDVAGATNAATSVVFTSTSSGGGTRGVSLDGVNGTWTLGTGALNANTQAAFYLQNANASQITYGGNLAPSGTGRAVLIGTADGNSGVNASNGLEAGSLVTLSGNITAGGIAVYESSGGTLTLNSSSHTWSTGTTRGVDLIDNNGATINFSGGNLAITTSSGIGFHASQGGTVNVTGGNNTITTTNGQALDIVGTSGETMGGGHAWKSISADADGAADATNTSHGIRVQFLSGGFSISGDGADVGTAPDSLTSGGTIDGAQSRGIELSNVTGAISLGGITITDSSKAQTITGIACGLNLNTGNNTSCAAALHLETTPGGVTLNTMSINGSVQGGINGFMVTNLTMSNIEVQNVGNEVGENGILIKNLLGSGTATSLNLHNNAAKQLHFINTGNNDLTSYTISSSTFANTFSPNGGQGVLLEGYDAGTSMSVTVNNGTFSNIWTNAHQVAANTGATITANVTNSAFTTVNALTVTQASDGSTVNFDISGNTYTSKASGSNAINIKTDNADLAGAPSNASGTISNNTIGTGVVGSGANCGGGCSGIQVAQDHGGTVTVSITNNTVQHVDVHGIRVLSGNGSGQLFATITGNLIRNPDGQVLEAINIKSGTVGTDTVCVQATIGGTVNPGAWPSGTANAMNRIEGNWDPTPGGVGGEIFLWETGTSKLAIPGGSAPISTFVAGRNSITSVDGTNVSTAGNVIAGTCP